MSSYLFCIKKYKEGHACNSKDLDNRKDQVEEMLKED